MSEKIPDMNRTDSERLASMETTLDDIKHRLFGNGRPGHIDGIYNRLSKLENWRWWVVGIAVGAGVVLGGYGHAAIEAMTK